MERKISYFSKSEIETINFAFSFSKNLKDNDILILEGNLGSGKTIFVKGLAKGFSIYDDIISPTFLIVNSYYGKNIKLNHFDLYKIEDFDELYYIGIEEYLENKGNINIFEWGMKFIDYFISYNVPNIFIIKIKIVSEDEREIEVEKIK
jgi:tRNA threonylcarbamoyladenosine biosynthesis protein TsaE